MVSPNEVGQVIFEILDDNSLKQIDIIEQRKNIVEKLTKYVDPERLLMEILKGLLPEQVMELHECAVEKEERLHREKDAIRLKTEVEEVHLLSYILEVRLNE